MKLSWPIFTQVQKHNDWTGNWQCNSIFWSIFWAICHSLTACSVPMNCTTLDTKHLVLNWQECILLNQTGKWKARKQHEMFSSGSVTTETSSSPFIQTGKENNGTIRVNYTQTWILPSHACNSTHFHVCSMERCGKGRDCVAPRERWTDDLGTMTCQEHSLNTDAEMILGPITSRINLSSLLVFEICADIAATWGVSDIFPGVFILILHKDSFSMVVWPLTDSWLLLLSRIFAPSLL